MRVFTRFGIERTNSEGVIISTSYNLKKAEDFYYVLVGLELLDLKSFLSDMEINIQNQKEYMLKHDSNAFEFLSSNDFNYAHRVDVRYPYLLRNSAFISTYSLLESALNDICNHYKQKKYVHTDINKFRGAIIDKAKKFINIDIGIPTKQIEWKKMDHYRQIRNSIVHNRGYIFSSDADTRKINLAINRLKGSGISLRNQSMLELDENACINFIILIETLLLDICKSLTYLE
ncbi:hypothetical protein J2T13_003227 [Paenibacillus sp. DS2015]|uniref:hypothetical protein n=1 Tax=Paenibacillus sp. DS2015 TaxID=3373917 RepID=UPI003D22319D